MDKHTLIEHLALEPHIEGGYFKRTYQADHQPSLPTDYGLRLRLSSIFYMLTDEAPKGRWHLNRSDILHFFHHGSPLTYHLIDSQGQLSRVVLGPDPSQGHCLQFCVPAGTWKATHLTSGSYGLLSEAVCPGFEFEDMTLGERGALLKRFEQHRHLIEQFTPPMNHPD